MREDIKLRLYIDGLDEISTDPKEDDIKVVLSAPVMEYPLVLTSRNEIASRAVGERPLSWSFAPFIEIEDWSLSMATEFFKRLFLSNGREDLLEDLLSDTVQKQVISLIRNPLMAVMMAFLIHESDMQWPSEVEDKAALFKEFLDAWIKRETKRLNVPSNQGKIERDIRYSWHLAAWEIYQSRRNSEKLTIDQLKSKIKEQHHSVSYALLDSTCFCSLIVIQPVTKNVLGFAHEQFMEYLVAELFHKLCLNNDSRTEKYLARAVTSEVNDFIKAIWGRSPVNELEKVVNGLEDRFNSISNNISGIQCKANIIYYWSRIPAREIQNDIRRHLWKVANNENHPYVRNGAFFALIRLGDKQAETYLYESLNTNNLADSYNRRLHLEYFGDVEPQGEPPYEDDLRCAWNQTCEKLLEHVENNTKERFILSRRIDIYTIHSLMNSRGRKGPLDGKGIERIEKSLKQAINIWPVHKELIEAACNELKELKISWEMYKL